MTASHSKKDSQADARTQAEEICQKAYDRWHELYCDPDAYMDPGKIRAMHEARLDYQDALLTWLEVLRSDVGRGSARVGAQVIP